MVSFKVIIGNPPYQKHQVLGEDLTSYPIYQKFVETAVSLDPQYISFIIPAKWYTSGKGLAQFRQYMFGCGKINRITDYADSSWCFKSIDLSGGIMYFLWVKEWNSWLCNIVNVNKYGQKSTNLRHITERFPNGGGGFFIRNNDHYPIIEKVLLKMVSMQIPTFDSQVQTFNPFGVRACSKEIIPSNAETSFYKDELVPIVYYSKSKRLTGLVPKSEITDRAGLDKYNVVVSKVKLYGTRAVISPPIILNKGTACTDSYSFVGSFDTWVEAKQLCDYLDSKFARFMILPLKNNQHITKQVWRLVPYLKDIKGEGWALDNYLCKYFGITQNEYYIIDSYVDRVPILRSE